MHSVPLPTKLFLCLALCYWYHKTYFSAYILALPLLLSLTVIKLLSTKINRQERNGGIFVSHYFKNITELLCKTISILTSTPKTVDVF